MRYYINFLTRLGVIILFFINSLIIPGCVESESTGSKLKFNVSFAENAHNENITGRVYVIISKSNDRNLFLQTGFTGVPIWGKNVIDLEPGEYAIINDTVFGYPLENIRDIPKGDYYVQAFVNKYTEFKRSDGHTIWLHNDQWEGQQWKRSPGNMYSEIKQVHIDPSKSSSIKLVCDQVIPPVIVPPDTKYVKRIKFASKILTEFWGQPIYLGATILLPKGYDEHPNVYYPVNYAQGHFSLRAPHGFRLGDPNAENERNKNNSSFADYWLSENCPRMLAITFQHPCPYYDDSYAVNTPNVGPYGDALMEELIPYLEENFRIIAKPYARVLSGGSTGGWESMALQVFHPDFFGGTWSGCPDPIDFRRFQLQNIYEDENMYYTEHEWLKVDIPETRSTSGDLTYTMEMRLHLEQVIGDKNRSGMQWAIWEALYTPLGEDGYPKPTWDWKTGKIDPVAAEHWKKYDLSLIMRNNWETLGPKLVGKIHLYAGDMDNAYLNLAVELVEEFLESTKFPYYDGTVEYGRREGHCWMPRGKELFEKFADQITKYAPAGEHSWKWKYK